MIVGMGIDLCEVERVDRLLGKDRQRFVRRVFLEAEARYCEARRHPAVHYAARLAAKEAFMKAVGTGWNLGWRQVEVVRERGGKPALALSGAAAAVAERRSVNRIHLTLTHTQESALAVVVLERSSGEVMEGKER